MNDKYYQPAKMGKRIEFFDLEKTKILLNIFHSGKRKKMY